MNQIFELIIFWEISGTWSSLYCHVSLVWLLTKGSSFRSAPITSKSTGLDHGRFFFSFWFYCQTDSGSCLPSAEAYNPHQMFHITQCEKPPIPQILFYKSTHSRKLDISYFILVCGCHCKWTPVHMQLPDCCLWSAWPWLIADGEQMKEISRDFMGIATMARVARASY